MTSALHAEGPGFDPRPEYPQHLFDPGGEDLERGSIPWRAAARLHIRGPHSSDGRAQDS
jgi:hypothetical protein